jgi:hypothetical protein
VRSKRRSASATLGVEPSVGCVLRALLTAAEVFT